MNESLVLLVSRWTPASVEDGIGQVLLQVVRRRKIQITAMDFLSTAPKP